MLGLPRLPHTAEVLGVPVVGKVAAHRNRAITVVGHVEDARVPVGLNRPPALFRRMRRGEEDLSRQVNNREAEQQPRDEVLLPELIGVEGAARRIVGRRVAAHQALVVGLQELAQVSAHVAVGEATREVVLLEPPPVDEPTLHTPLFVAPEAGVVGVHVLVREAAASVVSEEPVKDLTEVRIEVVG